MDIRPRDTYKVESHVDLSAETVRSLTVLYQPLIGGDGVLIWLTLASEAESSRTQDTHQRLFSLMDMHADTFERARARLEEYMLVRSYVREGENRNSYVYVLNQPMRAQDFFESNVFTARYIKAVGQKQFELTTSRLEAGTVSLQGYKDITRAVRNTKEENLDNDVHYTKIRQKYTFAGDDTTINFDYEHFIAITSVLVFPAELRTQENLYLIGKLATVYGLSPERMCILVSRCVSIDTMEFNGEKLKVLASRQQPDITKARDPYALSPVSFLQAKQNGAAVSLTDRHILEHLSMDMKFSNEVINVMIEYILKISDNRLNPKFVDMVAGEWARDGISTKEQALLETKKQLKTNAKHISVKVPEYYRKQQEGKKQEEHQASSGTIEEIRKMQKEMGGEN